MEEQYEDKVETKREIAVNAFGETISETITYEKTPKKKVDMKEFLELTVKVFGVVAIIVPILVFLQQKVEHDREREYRKFTIYSQLSIELHKYSNEYKFFDTKNMRAQEKSKDSIVFVLLPECLLFSDFFLTKDLKFIGNEISLLFYYYYISDIRDSVYLRLLEGFSSTIGNREYIKFRNLKRYNEYVYNISSLESTYLTYLKPESSDYDSLKNNCLIKDSIIKACWIDFNLRNGYSQGGFPKNTEFYPETILKIDEIDSRIINRVKANLDLNIYTFDSLLISTNRLAQ